MRTSWMAVLMPLLIAAPVHATGAPASQAGGLWINPHKSVAVKTGPCAGKLCGWIVWANEEAQADARSGGVAKLIGTELLENYSMRGPNSWTGTVFVPDMGKRFSSRIEQISATQLRIKGCILGGLICKSQTWSRIDRLPNG